MNKQRMWLFQIRDYAWPRALKTIRTFPPLNQGKITINIMVWSSQGSPQFSFQRDLREDAQLRRYSVVLVAAETSILKVIQTIREIKEQIYPILILNPLLSKSNHSPPLSTNFSPQTIKLCLKLIVNQNSNLSHHQHLSLTNFQIIIPSMGILPKQLWPSSIITLIYSHTNPLHGWADRES